MDSERKVSILQVGHEKHSSDIYIAINNWTADIRFPAFSLASWIQVITSYSCTAKWSMVNERVIENRLVAELTCRNSNTGPKYEWNSLPLSSECLRKTKTRDIIVIKKFFSQPRENFPCCWCSASSEIHFHLLPTARVYKLNLIKLTHWKSIFYQHLIHLQTSNFQFLQLGCIRKDETNRCSGCCCYSVPPPRIRQISDL